MSYKRGENNFFCNFIYSKTRKGQGLSVNAIILIVLGLVVLVLLIIGFVFGFGQFKSVRDAFLPTNTGIIVKACEVACSTNSQFDFCSQGRELKTDDKILKDVTCNYLSKKNPELGIGDCASVSCSNVVFVNVVAQDLLANQCAGNEGKIVQALIQDNLVSYTCP